MTHMQHTRSDSRVAHHVPLVCNTQSMTQVQCTRYDSRAVTPPQALTDPSNKISKHMRGMAHASVNLVIAVPYIQSI